MPEEVPNDSQSLQIQGQSNAPVVLLHNSRATFDDGLDVLPGYRQCMVGGRIAVPSHLPLERGELGLLEVRLLTADGNPEGCCKLTHLGDCGSLARFRRHVRGAEAEGCLSD